MKYILQIKTIMINNIMGSKWSVSQLLKLRSPRPSEERTFRLKNSETSVICGTVSIERMRVNGSIAIVLKSRIDFKFLELKCINRRNQKAKYRHCQYQKGEYRYCPHQKANYRYWQIKSKISKLSISKAPNLKKFSLEEKRSFFERMIQYLRSLVPGRISGNWEN
ncbi:unnamed protein product, partial [Nesidiocoris tenuis]